ncbi:MAG TPA: N-methyl-L-tryptophan oxidase [Caulobacteraceae bacterium]
MSESAYDLVVVGLGAAGSATVREAARRGARVLGLDAHHPPHDRGSSHGESRITRQAIGEGLDYVPLALRSHPLWRQLEAETGETLMRTVGALMISAPDLGAVHHGKPDFLEQTIEAAQAFGIDHEVLDAAATRKRYPQFQVRDHERAYFEPGAGILYPERCIAAQLAAARSDGAAIRTGERVRAIEPTAGRVRVVSDAGICEAGQVVIAAGAWTGQLLGGVWSRRLILHRQSLHWFQPDDPAPFAPERFPVFIWMHGADDGDWFYGFPQDPQVGGVKIASEQFAIAAPGPDAWDRTADRDEALAAYDRHVVGRIDALPRRWLRSTACIYTDAPESQFVIGPDPERANVIVVSACSGHGFKHSPAIGEAVAAWALDGAAPPILSPFAPDRLLLG